MTASLRKRLLAGTLAWLLLTVAGAGWGLRALFLDHITEQLQAQLLVQLDALTARLDWGADQSLQIAPTAQSDPRWQQPLSGLYWQVQRRDAPQAVLARSRSLWDQALELPSSATNPGASNGASNGASSHEPGPQFLPLQDTQGHRLQAVVRRLQLPDEGAPALLLIVAGDEALLAEPLQRFTRLLLVALGLLALGLALAVVLQLQLALRPLQLLRERLAQVRSGQAAQLQGPFPQELQGLVDEFNHVLGENADMVARARTQAGNLAHAVHTPLAILANAAAQENTALAQLVGEQIDSARRQVDWHLARARAAAAVRATGLATPARPVLQALLRTMARLHAGRGIDFAEAENPSPDTALVFRGEEQDLYELLGNLIDNAGKNARRQVLVNMECQTADPGPGDGQGPNDWLIFTIDDDGPGIPMEQRQALFARGVQLDDQRPGSGLGLDIVRSLAQTYGGGVQVLDAPLGGARLVLRLPAATPTTKNPP